MTLEDQVIFQMFGIKGYDYEATQNKAHFSHENDEVDPDYLLTLKAPNLEKKQAIQED